MPGHRRQRETQTSGRQPLAHWKDDRVVIPQVVMEANPSYQMVSGEQQVYFFRPD